MTGTYKTFPDDKPIRVRVVEWLGNRVLLQEIDRPKFMYDTSLDSFTPDIPEKE